jgi:hypothetical protein
MAERKRKPWGGQDVEAMEEEEETYAEAQRHDCSSSCFHTHKTQRKEFTF